MQEELARAEQGVKELLAIRKDRWYPKFHIAGLAGWINDPNGLCYFNGRYHVFFQHHPFSAQWGPMYWGHVSSSDMITWRREPIALAPSVDADRDGVFSGSAAVSDNGALVVYFTGNRWRNDANRDDGGVQVQCVALSTDGIHFEKKGIVVDLPEDLAHFRDPKVWRMGEVWYMVVGVCSADNRGEVWLYTSADMSGWEFDRILFRDPNPDVFMLECPDVFRLGDKWVLVCSPMGLQPDGYLHRNDLNAGYVVGNWEPGADFEQITDYRPLDWGGQYYAAQSFEAPGGRRIILAWMGSFAVPLASQAEDGWSGQLTVPRELGLGADNRLIASPIAELTALRTESTDFGAFELGPDEDKLLLTGVDAADVELVLDLTASTAERVGLAVNKTPDGHETLVAWDDLAKRVLVDRRNAGAGERGYRAAPFSGDVLELRVLVDRASVEVFVNNGVEAVTSFAFPAEGPRSIELYTESGSAKIDRLAVHRLGSIWEDKEGAAG
jgi:beta-fructofuranosidase